MAEDSDNTKTETRGKVVAPGWEIAEGERSSHVRMKNRKTEDTSKE